MTSKSGATMSAHHPMIPVHEALHLILQSAADYLTSETFLNITSNSYENLSLNDALDRCSAHDIHAPFPIPRVPTSIMDGFCINFEKCILRNKIDVVECIVTGYSVAGRSSMVVQNDLLLDNECEARYITTGAALPQGFDTVIPIEQVNLKIDEQHLSANITNIVNYLGEKNNARVSIVLPNKANTAPGDWTRKVGSDLKQNATLIHRGQTITPIQIGILAHCGFESVQVLALPKVGVLSTGDELLTSKEMRSANINERLDAGFIFDTNRPTLLALIKRFGGLPIDLKKSKDNATDLERMIRTGLENCDVLVTSGGVSMGEFDLLEKVMVEVFGASVKFGRIHMKPGKPTTFFVLNSESFRTKFILSLPGNPVSAVVCSHLFLKPLVHLLRVGCNKNQTAEEILDNAGVHPEIDAVLMNDLNLDLERPEYHRVLLKWDTLKHKCLAFSTGMQRSSRFMSMNDAMGLMCLPQGNVNGKRTCKAGEMFPVLVIDGYLAPGMGIVKFKESRHALGKCFAELNTEADRCPLNISIICHAVKCSTNEIVERVKFSMRNINIVHAISTTSSDNLGDIINLTDVSIDIFLIVVSSDFRRNLDVSSTFSKLLEKSADALALQMKKGGVTQNGLNALLEFAAGSAKGKLLLMIPDLGLEGALASIAGALISHAVMIAKRKTH